jgi:MraZ protein
LFLIEPNLLTTQLQTTHFLPHAIHNSFLIKNMASIAFVKKNVIHNFDNLSTIGIFVVRSGKNRLILPIINVMFGLVGEYEVKLDGKGRFLFPSHLRRQISPAAQENFMLNKGFEDCLSLFPMNEWEKVSEKLSKLNLFKPKNRMFYRLFHQGAKQLALDTAGRILIPTALMERVGLKKEIMLIAYNDRIEIWDKSKYFELLEGNMTDFADLAEEVMGGLNDSE